MEIAADAAATGGCRIRDLPPSKRFKFVGSSRLGPAPCVPLPETAPLPVCLPAKKRAYAPAVAEVALKACLPAKKRAYAPLPDDIVPACLPAKKRVYVPPPPPLEDAAAHPPVPAKKRVHPLLPPGGAAAAPSSTKKRVHMPLPSLPENSAVSPPIPVRKRVQPVLPPRGATAAPSASAKKRVHVPLPLPPADAAASSSIPAKKKVHPPEAIAAPLSIPSKKLAQTPSPAEDDSSLAPVSLQANKRVMSPFICPSPCPPVESDGARVAAVKQPRSQRSVKRGGATDPRAAKGAVDCTRAEAFKVPANKPVKPKEVQEQASIKSGRASTAKESSDLHRKKLCDVVNGRQSEVQAEVLEKFEQAIDPQVVAPAREEEPKKEAEEVATEQKQEAAGEEDEEDGVLCAVCGSTDGDPSDPIVFCDGCDLMVHASCYGSPLAQSIPEGDWFCSLCSDKALATAKKGGKPPRPHCCLCPARGGAMKRTTDGAWAHIACALLVPEVFFQDPDGRDGIDCSRVPGHRYTKRCYICESSRGCALECSQPKCGLGFHVSCGLKGGLCIEYREEKAGAVVAGFCREHTKLWDKQQLTGKYKIVSRGHA